MIRGLATRSIQCDNVSRWHSTTSKTQVFSEKRRLGYTKEQFFKVVSEVENYHKFVPWCSQSDVIKRNDHGLEAKLVVGFPPFTGESYTSIVTFYKPFLVTATSTDLHLLDHLKAVWTLQDCPNQPAKSSCCEVHFALSFQFRMNMHSITAKLFFDRVAKQNVTAFHKEAQRRFGPEARV